MPRRRQPHTPQRPLRKAPVRSPGWLLAFAGAPRAELLIAAMALDDKIALMHGVNRIKGDAAMGYDFDLPPNGYVGYLPPNWRLGIPALTLAVRPGGSWQ